MEIILIIEILQEEEDLILEIKKINNNCEMNFYFNFY